MQLLRELTLFGEIDRVKTAVERLQTFEPAEGYYLAFSGGKDSLCIYHLAKEAGVKFTAYYHLTTVDPPELVYFIREHYPDVIVTYPEMSMWKLIVWKKFPPLRQQRFCCEYLKEGGGMGHTTITGVRWAESNKRRKTRGVVEIGSDYRKRLILNNDNDEARQMLESCVLKSKHVINPIIDWSDSDVWEYIALRDLKYCVLYDRGFERLGCIGCPLAGPKTMKWEFAQYPKYYEAYIRAFGRMVQNRIDTGLDPIWTDGREVMLWWLGDKKIRKADDPQIMFEDMGYEEY